MRETVPSKELATQIDPKAETIAVGPLPTWIVRTTSWERGSICTTMSLDWSITHSEPAPTAMPRPSAPDANVARTLPLAGSISEMDRSPAFVTQTEPSPNVTAVGWCPTVIGWTTRSVPGSMRETVPLSVFATQTAPAPVARSLGLLPTGIVCTTNDVSIPETVSSAWFVTQTAPPAVASRPGETGVTSDRIRPEAGSTAPTPLKSMRASPELPPPVSSSAAATLAPTSATATHAAISARWRRCDDSSAA